MAFCPSGVPPFREINIVVVYVISQMMQDMTYNPDFKVTIIQCQIHPFIHVFIGKMSSNSKMVQHRAILTMADQ